MTLAAFTARRAALGPGSLIVCHQCGALGEAGCPHVVNAFVARPAGIPASRFGSLLIDAATPISIAISSTTGVPIRPRW